MAREIKITAAFVNTHVTEVISTFLIDFFGAYSCTEGFGGYTMTDGTIVEEPNVSWFVAVADPSLPDIAQLITYVARAYCRLGKQESIYFVDAEGECWIVFADGHHEAIK